MDEEQKALTLLCSSKQVTPSLVGQRQANSHHRALAFVSEQETLVRNLNEPNKTKRGGMSKDRIITVSRILYLDLNMFCTLVADYGNSVTMFS